MNPVSPLEAILHSHLDSYPVALPVAGSSDPAVQILCDGSVKLRTLLPRIDATVLAGILDSVIWLDEPLTVTGDGKRCLVLATQPEEAFLSMGGYLLKRRGRLNCLNAICFSPAAGRATVAGFQTHAELSFARCSEAGLNARIAGIRNHFLNLPAGSLRAALGLEPDRQEQEERFRNSLYAWVYQLIVQQRPSDVFAPAALGENADRRSLFDAILRIFEAGYFPDVRFHLYEVFPEASDHLTIDTFISSVENVYVRLRPWFDDVTTVVKRKRQLMEVMQASPPVEWNAVMHPVARRNGVLAREHGACAERFWTLRLTFGRN